MKEWFTDYKDVIAGFAGIATAIGLLATATAIAVAALQLRDQRRLNRATAVYQVQQDARAMAAALLESPARAKAVFGRQPPAGKAAIASVINFYSAVFQLRQYQVLDADTWEPFAKDFLVMFESEGSRAQWDKSKSSFDPTFVADIERRLGP
ncbi:hypothetical protein ACFQW6_03720 [Nocardioides sp. GCM10028917]|jgi:hypothetical protein|uniref:hypothetical protein n=1 Tax=Nocardioides sp. GCM10028917 TaxID=3273408 RepID=UPI003611AD72